MYLYTIYKYRKPYACNKEFVQEFTDKKKAEEALNKVENSSLSRFYGFELEVSETISEE